MAPEGPTCGRWPALAVLVALLIVGLSLQADDRFAPGMARDFVHKIQDYRQSSSADKRETRKPRWDRWSYQEVHCPSTLWRVADALAAQECGKSFAAVEQEAAEFFAALAEVLLSSPQGSFPGTFWEGLEATAKGLGIPVETGNCLAKTYVRFSFPPGPRREEWLRKTQGVTDAVNLAQFVRSIRAFNAQGAKGLGKTTAQQAKGAASTGSGGATQSRGWLEGLFAVADDSFVTRKGLDEARLAEMSLRLQRCHVDSVKADYAAIKQAALDYVFSTRDWVTSMEQEVYCGLEPSQFMGLSKSLIANRLDLAIGSDLKYANFFERQAVGHYGSIVDDSRFIDSAFDAKTAELERVAATLSTLRQKLNTLYQTCPGDDALSDIERTIEQAGESYCFELAWERAGLGGSLDQMRRRVTRYVSARRAFFSDVREAGVEAMSLADGCRFDEGQRRFTSHLERFDRTWDPFTQLTFRRCWAPPHTSDPWPLDELDERARQANEQIAERRAATDAAFGRSISERLACRWIASQDELDAAHGLLDEVTAICPNVDWYGPAMQRLGELETTLRDTKAYVQPLLDQWDRETRDLLHEMEVELYRAEDPAEPERCAAVEAALRIGGRASALQPPAECEEIEDGGFQAQVQEKLERARIAKELGLAEFDRHLEFAGVAEKRCDRAALANHIQAIEALPQPCGRDREVALVPLRERDRQIERETDAYRAKIPLFEADWQAAYDACQLDRIVATANRIKAWGQNSCTIRNLSDADRGRVEALKRHTPEEAATIVSMTNNIRDRLRIKIDLARGYINTLQTKVGQLFDEEYYREHIERHLEGARDLVAYIKAFHGEDLPPYCYNDLVGELNTLRPELERLIASMLPPASSADNAAATADWTDAAKQGSVTSKSSTANTVTVPPPPPSVVPSTTDPGVADRAARAADRARADKARSRETAAKVAEALSDMLGQATSGSGRPPAPPPPRPPTGSTGTGGPAATGGSTGKRCIIDVYHYGAQVHFLVEAPGGVGAPTGYIAWSVDHPGEEVRDVCRSARACLQIVVRRMGNGAQVLPGNYPSSSAAVDAAKRDYCPKPLVPIGATRRAR